VLTEGRHTAEHILEEGVNARKSITLLAGEVVVAGQVLGKILADRGAVTVGAPAFTGTGDGALTKADPAYGAGVQEGTYKVRLVEAGANAGQFAVIRPDGTIDGLAAVGVAYDGQVKFTIADGATDFAAAAEFTLAVTLADPAGAGKWKGLDPAAVDGSEIAAGVAYGNYDATGADIQVVASVRNSRLVAASLTWPAGITADQKAAALAELDALNLVAN
ncbi:MAG: head decoration protein, partial [Bauldia sp.]